MARSDKERDVTGLGALQVSQWPSGQLVEDFQPPQTFTVRGQMWQALTPSLRGSKTGAIKGQGARITQLAQARQGCGLLFLSSLHTQICLWARRAGRTGHGFSLGWRKSLLPSSIGHSCGLPPASPVPSLQPHPSPPSSMGLPRLCPGLRLTVAV